MKTLRSGYIYPWTYPSNWIHNIKELPRFIKRRFQRGRYGICLYDVWDLDFYMLQVFENGIKELRKNLHSYPSQLTPQEWDNILARMEGFVEVIKIDGLDGEGISKYCEDNDFRIKTPEEWERYRQECLEELCDMMKIWFFHLWD